MLQPPRASEGDAASSGSGPDVQPASLQALGALGERLAQVTDETALADLATAAAPSLLGARVVGWLTEAHERCAGADWDETSRLVLRRAALAAPLRAGRCVVLEAAVLPPTIASALAGGAVVAAPLRMQRDPVGVLVAVLDRPDTQAQTLLAMLAQLASSCLGGLRMADLLRSEARELESQLDARSRELRRAEQQIINSDRLATLGTLVAGIGHEITNPLATVMLNNGALVNRLARAGLPAGLLTEAQRLVAENDEALERIRGLVGELRTFSRKDDDSMHPIDLRPVIESALRLCRAHLRHVDLHVELATLPAVRGSASRLGQVFLNLLVNAAQAVHGAVQPRISLRATTVGERVRVGVADNGPGVPDAVRPKIFEMFFTTKAAHEGTGLGLAIARDIIVKHGGTIELESEAGAGATFWVDLPTLAADAAAGSRRGLPSSPGIKPARRKPSMPHLAARPEPRPRLLIIDDEVMILRALERELDSDFEVVSARSSEEALVAVQAGRFDAVLCDVNLAGENGYEVVQRLDGLAAGLATRTVFMSGGPIAEKPRATGSGKFVAKPFQVPALLQLLRGVAAG
jgi:signal transduction histidine kinase